MWACLLVVIVVDMVKKGGNMVKKGGIVLSKGLGLQGNHQFYDCSRRVGTTVRGCEKRNYSMSWGVR